MTSRRHLLGRSFTLSVLLPLTLAGCALMGGGKPATLFQFGDIQVPAADNAAAPQGPPTVILYRGSTFERQSGGDRIVTSIGNQMAYVAAARWIAPAAELFDAATIRGLEGSSPSVRVVGIKDRARPDFILSIDVRRFEANYFAGAKAAPEILIEARVRLERATDQAVMGDWPIAQRELAGDNRISAIVSAFDRATAKVTGQIASYAGARLQKI